MTNMLPTVSLIYLSYFSEPFLEEVILSLEQLDYPKEKIKLIFVDNASTDKSCDIIREKLVARSGESFPEVLFFPQEENTGFAKGNNLGINHALLDGTDYVYLHNNDAKLHKEAIKEAVLLAESDRQIGSVQSTMCLWQNEDILNSTGGMVHFLGFGYVRDNGSRQDSVQYKDGEEIAYASGAAVLYRASALREVGLLDPYLFLYHEDLELGWRLRLAGYKNVLSTKSMVYHHYEFKRSIQKFYWMERNRLLVHLSHLRWKTIFLLAPWLIGLEFALLPLSFKGGWFREKFFVWVAWLSPKTWKYLAKKRKESAIIRRVKDKEIVRLFVGKIAHQDVASPIVDRFANPLLSFVWRLILPLIRW
jgi:GT2 family glycosyltransferase